MRFGLGVLAAVIGLAGSAQAMSGMEPSSGSVTLSRSEYAKKMEGFWMGQSIANFTGLITEGLKNEPPFFTDESWGGLVRDDKKIEFIVTDVHDVWNSDDDTDVEYMYQDALFRNNTSMLTAEQIRDAWVSAIRELEERKPDRLWVSNHRAWELMKYDGLLPPATSLPENNSTYDMIDAQLTTEIFGLFAPALHHVALEIAHLPIRTVAYREAEWIAEFYVIMHSLASVVDSSLSMKDQVFWLAEKARKRLPDSYASDMYDFIKAEYESNPDKNDWEKTRDDVYQRYVVDRTAGYKYREWYDAGINYAASLVALFYGEGDYKRTVQIAVLSGWDSDNPAATWAGLLGFMIGPDALEEAFGKEICKHYRISWTRANFPDRTPGRVGEDTFDMMAQRGLKVIDRVVIDQMGGVVDGGNDCWVIPLTGKDVVTARDTE